ncbi:MAG: peptidylprolyl isomerase [Anaerolineae bacterium]|nr:peptidylprolyl isomerase [Anaerolineae bacterium]
MTKGRPTHAPRKLTKKQASRHRREATQTRWIWTAVVAVAAVVVIVVAIGVISQSTQKVAIVNGEPVKATDFQRRVRYYYYALGPDVFESNEEDPDQIYRLIADQLVEEALIRQEAAKRGITATEEEIEIEMEETWFQHYRNAPPPTATPTVDPGATPTPQGTPPSPTATPDTEETYQANYELFVDNVLRAARVGESYVREMAKVNILADKLEEAIIAESPAEEEQIHFRYTTVADAEAALAKIAELQAGVRTETQARHILVATLEEAEAVLRRLKDGEDFVALAAELSLDTSNKDEGGDLGWFPRGAMVDAFDEAAFTGEPGLYPVPVETEFGFHVIEILGREEREIDLDTELFDVGWYGKPEMADQFGALFAEMVFGSELGLITEPVPTDFGVAVVETLEREVRPLDEADRESRRGQAFQEWLEQIREEGEIEDLYEPSLIPAKI